MWDVTPKLQPLVLQITRSCHVAALFSFFGKLLSIEVGTLAIEVPSSRNQSGICQHRFAHRLKLPVILIFAPGAAQQVLVC